MDTKTIRAILTVMNLTAPEGYLWAARKDHRPTEDQRRLRVNSQIQFLLIGSQSDLRASDSFIW